MNFPFRSLSRSSSASSSLVAVPVMVNTLSSEIAHRIVTFVTTRWTKTRARISNAMASVCESVHVAPNTINNFNVYLMNCNYDYNRSERAHSCSASDPFLRIKIEFEQPNASPTKWRDWTSKFTFRFEFERWTHVVLPQFDKKQNHFSLHVRVWNENQMNTNTRSHGVVVGNGWATLVPIKRKNRF